jgi:O-antigen/teichoic acid export membrane protein
MPGTHEPILGLGEPGDEPIRPIPDNNLRTSALQGGVYLVIREIVGIGIRLIGVVIITRLIGPNAFGIYASAAAVVGVVAVTSQMGMEVYLIRQAGEPESALYDQVFTFLLVVSVTLSVCAAGLTVAAEHLIHGFEPTGRVLLVLLVSVPFNVLWAPAQAKIERAFGYRRMAWLELGGDITLYVVGIVLAVMGTGAMSLAVAYVAWQFWLLVGSYWLAKMRPRWRWSLSTNRALLHHGTSYSATGILVMLKGLVNPVVVGYFCGTTSVGFVAFAMRLLDTFGFAQRATWRLTLVAISRVRDQSDRLLRGIQEGMLLQLLSTAPPILALVVVSKWIIPIVFGPVWLPAVPVLALLAIAQLVTTPLTVEYAVLYTHARNALVAMATTLNVAVTFGLAVPLIARFGINGFGWATIAASATWITMHLRAKRALPLSYLPLLPYFVAAVPIAAFPLIGWPLDLLVFVPGAIVLMFPSVRAELRRVGRTTWSGLIRRKASS